MLWLFSVSEGSQVLVVLRLSSAEHECCQRQGKGGGGVSLAEHKRMLQRRKDISLTLEEKLELRAR